ncbi:hypothetical protein [Streptomyces sp. NPDC019890]|uniref:hypothetical protein n=1 Tax=Streptomyces sp. NPDC019890 TaxID=3365064 RepID=UPI00384B98E0
MRSGRSFVGQVCLTANEEVDLPGLLKKLSGRYGRPRHLAMGGYVDPTVTERTGLPLLASSDRRHPHSTARSFDTHWFESCPSGESPESEDD